ncbi:uncharacterized protein DUF2630 [Nocardia ignorata]|uniref:Uncharacterized protein DUF2630 n=2 Tax=Nocardia TaxID=1817 RepID=A0A4R6PUR2_NOCIG|nr:uncharacterized protein DUF2630 [Nocardia ignorata]
MDQDPRGSRFARHYPSENRSGEHMTDQDILAKIKQLVDEEHELRSKATAGEIDPVSERKQLAQLEVMLDQAWDLLRQRRARAGADASPEDTQMRSPREVEGYLQ